ncbi:low-affinity phosphate transporter [Friedmanniomyces endolithicus]|nr:low-affinity phosphate transporter [Friedmanniomyces endolithicus]
MAYGDEGQRTDGREDGESKSLPSVPLRRLDSRGTSCRVAAHIEHEDASKTGQASSVVHHLLYSYSPRNDRCGSQQPPPKATLERTQTRWASRRQPRLSKHHHIIDIELQSLPPLALDGTSSALPSPDLPGFVLKRRAKLYSLLEADMKFSHSIQFNAVPDWSSRYISYSNLKKLIYQLEKQLNQANGASAGRKHDDAESSPLLSQSTSWSDNPDQVFAKKLEEELEKVCSFFQLKELEIYGEVDAILKDVEEFEAEHAAGEREGEGHGVRRQSLWARARQQSIFKNFQLPQPRRRRSSTMGTQRTNDSRPRDTEDIQEGEESEEEDAGEGTALTKGHAPDLRTGKWESGKNLGGSTAQHDRRTSVDQNSSAEVRRRPSMVFNDFGDDALQALYDEGITLKKRIVNLYVDVSELRSFVQLNEKGFSKVLKKYDKVLDRNLKSSWIDAHVKPAIIFQSSTMEHMSEHLSRLEQGYASIVTSGDVEAARRALRLHLREHVVWERNTVWREMIGIERKAQAANLGIRQTMLGQDTDPKKARLQGDEEDGHTTKEVQTLVGRYRCPKFLLSGTFWVLVACCAIFAVLLGVRFMDAPEQQNCLALIVFVSSLWATEAIPLFVTSLLVPFLVVILRVVRQDEKPHARLESKAAATYIFAAMWTPVIMLLLGGFTIAAALSKYNIAKMMATFVLSKAGTKPRTVLLTAMGVAMFASMWISNVAAPVLCFSIIQPILRNLPSDSDMSKALILGIALASNMGGAASPIASPQNLIALQNMEPQPGWGIWFFIALPVCIITILLIWLLLLVTFRPGRNTTIIPIRPMKDKFTGIQWFISFVTLATIVLWCVSHQLEGVFGDMGVIAIIPIALFFGTGILTKEDFNNFLWTIIILAAGGLALGKAVNSSGLLTTIAVGITQRVQGLSLYAVTCVFCALIALVATFISHTVAALIILPLVREVGLGMAEPHPNLLVMASVLMASAAMGLPTSGFPNMTAIMMEDPQTGRRYLQVRHFLTRGVPSSIMAFGVVVSVGYGCMIAVGF